MVTSNRMEKLIELLNEWERERVNHNTKEFIPYGESSFSDLSVERITSKKYGFIRYLVDNDQIDLDILKDNTLFTMFTHSVGVGRDWRTISEGESVLKAIGTDALIAYISIQDKPIDFLISILK